MFSASLRTGTTTVRSMNSGLAGVASEGPLGCAVTGPGVSHRGRAGTPFRGRGWSIARPAPPFQQGVGGDPDPERICLAFILRGIRPYIALVLLSLALNVPGLVSLPPFDRDEARFAQATRQMVEDGDLIRIRFQNEPRHKK